MARPRASRTAVGLRLPEKSELQDTAAYRRLDATTCISEADYWSRIPDALLGMTAVVLRLLETANYRIPQRIIVVTPLPSQNRIKNSIPPACGFIMKE